VPGTDYAIYSVHTVFWWSFVVTRLILQWRERRRPVSAETAPVVRDVHTAPHARVLIAFHAVAFGLMYAGLGYAIGTESVPRWFPGQRVAGALVIVCGAALTVWALVYFQSWRFRATLDSDHVLATGGPFRLLRHPIYMALNLLALGSAIWAPTPVLWASVVLMAVGSDLRGRAEETLLTEVFGARYREYCARTSRFIPGVY
jgi:protein-S-isoprenylcysteine O-methyltransferase Ste14